MATERSRSRRDEQDDAEQNGGTNGREAPIDEGELATYLQERIKPGLNRGAIPLLARSIAREIARDEFHRDESEEEEGGDTDQLDESSDLAGGLHKLQAQLGEDWVLSLCVQGDDSWLVAEKSDVSQRLEAQDASVLREAVKLLDERGGRASSSRKDRASD